MSLAPDAMSFCATSFRIRSPTPRARSPVTRELDGSVRRGRDPRPVAANETFEPGLGASHRDDVVDVRVDRHAPRRCSRGCASVASGRPPPARRSDRSRRAASPASPRRGPRDPPPRDEELLPALCLVREPSRLSKSGHTRWGSGITKTGSDPEPEEKPPGALVDDHAASALRSASTIGRALQTPPLRRTTSTDPRGSSEA